MQINLLLHFISRNYTDLSVSQFINTVCYDIRVHRLVNVWDGITVKALLTC